MKASIIVMCHGNVSCLRYCFEQAKASNPGSKIHFLGDGTNDVYDAVEHHNSNDYLQTAVEFKKIYKHMDSSQRAYKLRNIQLYSFVLNEFVRANHIDKFLLIDIDVMLYCDIEKEFERLRAWDFSLGYTLRNNLEMCPSPIFWNNVEALNEFCDFITNMYAGKDSKNFKELVNFYNRRKRFPKRGNVGIMVLYALFVKKSRFSVYFVDEIDNDSTHELNMNIPLGGKYQYQMQTHRMRVKKLKWIGNRP